MANQQQNKFDLRTLVEAIDTVKQKITLLESNDQRLGMSNVLYFSFGDSFVCMSSGNKQTPGQMESRSFPGQRMVEPGICETEFWLVRQK